MWTVEERREVVLPAASVLTGCSQGHVPTFPNGRRWCSSKWEADKN